MNTEVIELMGAVIFILGAAILSIIGFYKYISLIIEAFRDKEWVEFCAFIGGLLVILGLILI